ncbi:MAG: RNA-directed DNA polymerase [Pseudomonadota bacterium]
MSESLLGFPIDIEATLKHLRQDMRDDWFYDAIRYEDLLSNGKSIHEILSKNLDNNHGEYKSGKKFVYDVPKRSLGLRYTIEIDFYDRFLYQAICTYLIPFFDPLLSNRVFSHRYNKHGKAKYLFKHRIELWSTFENISQLALVDSKTLLITDLINYFEQISIDSIEKAFIGMIANIDASGSKKNTIRNAVNTLKKLLEKWCYSNRHGLPQNRDASSFIANVVLDSVDKNMVSRGYDYFRYVDDIRIICLDEYEAKQALNHLIFELRKIGLNINSKKTIILDKNSNNIEDFFPSSNDTMTIIDAMWRSRSKRVITRSIPILFEFLKKQINEEATQGRPFRYCINRIKTLISNNLFDSKSILENEIVDSLIAEFYKQPVSTDQFCKILIDLDLSTDQLKAIGDFIVDKKVAIHGWQNYHLILLMSYKKFEYFPLVDFCKNLMINSINSLEVPACFIYLASIGKESEIENIIEFFDDNWSYQHQRHFLIALQNTKPEKLRPMYGKVCFRLKGTVSRLKQNKNFKENTIYIKDFNTTIIEEIYDEISPYD